MNLLLWMIAGMALGCLLLSVGRPRNDVAILVGLLAGAAGSVVAGVWATSETVATKLFGQPFSGVGFLAAAVGATAFAGVLRLLWHPGARSQTLAAMDEMDEIAARMPGARGPGAGTSAASHDARMGMMDGDTEPSAFNGGPPRTPRMSSAPDSAARPEGHPGLGPKQVTDP